MSSLLQNIIYRKSFLIAISILLVLAFLSNSIHLFNLKKIYGTPDLRNRIVGSRIVKQKEHTSPYFYKWNKEDGDRFLDMYDSPELLMNRNTVTPFTLQLLQLISTTNYSKLTKQWLIAEVFALLITILLILSLAKDSLNKLLILGISLIGTGLSQSWMLHSLSGQVYIFIPLLLSLVFYFSQALTKGNTIIVAIVLSILVLIRPTAILFILPFVLNSNWKILIYTFLLLAIYFLLSYTTGQFWLWLDYSKAMDLWSVESFNPHVTKSYMEVLRLKEIEESAIITQPPNLSLLEDSSIQGFLFRFFNIRLTTVSLLGIMFCFFTAFLFFLRKKIGRFDLQKIFILAFLLYFISELCIPAIRNSYNAVQWAFPLAILFLNKELSNSIKLILIIAVTFAIGMMKFFPFDLFMAEVLFFLSCSIYLKNSESEHA